MKKEKEKRNPRKLTNKTGNSTRHQGIADE